MKTPGAYRRAKALIPALTLAALVLTATVTPLASMPAHAASDAKLSAEALKEQEIKMQDFANEIVDAQKKGDTATVLRLVKSLLPNAERLDKGLNPKLPAATRDKIVAFHAKVPMDDAALAKLFAIKPDQTVVIVHTATTEQLAKNQRDTVASLEFPGGAHRLAKQASCVRG